MTLEQALKKAAYKVWKELKPFPNNNDFHIAEVREEGLTSMALKKLRKSNCSHITKIIMIPPNEEKTAGYDFELAIGSKLQGKYFRLFIQSKRLYGYSVAEDYGSIKFNQTEDLIRYSRKESSLGMYAFYNHLIENDNKLIDYFNSCTPFDKRSIGITTCSAYSVKMLQSKKFHDYHFNNGHRVSPRIYSLRNFPHLFYFHKISSSHLAVPFHELSYLTIDLAQRINRLYKKIKAQSKTHLLLLFFPGIENLLDGEGDLIPIIKRNSEQLMKEFYERVFDDSIDKEIYNPRALIIIDTDEAN
jgi:hypothetical protein